jgi:hypothetical protein
MAVNERNHLIKEKMRLLKRKTQIDRRLQEIDEEMDELLEQAQKKAVEIRGKRGPAEIEKKKGRGKTVIEY